MSYEAVKVAATGSVATIIFCRLYADSFFVRCISARRDENADGNRGGTIAPARASSRYIAPSVPLFDRQPLMLDGEQRLDADLRFLASSNKQAAHWLQQLSSRTS